MTNVPKQTMWPCTNPEIHAKVQQMLEDAAKNPTRLYELNIFKIIRGDMNEMDKMAIAAGLDQMSVEDRAAFKAAASEIVDVLESTFRDNKGIDMHRTEEINFDGDNDRLTVKKIPGFAGDYDMCEEMAMVKGVHLRGAGVPLEMADDASFVQLAEELPTALRPGPGPIDDNLHFEVIDESNIDKILKINHPETCEDDPIPPGRVIDGEVAKAIDATDADAIGIQHRPWPAGAERSGENDEKFQKVGTIASSKNSAALMAHMALQARQPGANIDLSKAIASDIMSPTNVEGIKAMIDRQYHPAIEHTLSAAKSKHYLNAAAGWSMMNPSAHQFLWVQFYGDDTEYQVERATRTYGGVLQFTLSDQRIINVGSIDKQNTCLLLQNPKVRAIRVKSSRRY